MNNSIVSYLNDSIFTPDSIICRYVNSIPNVTEQCEFVLRTDSCRYNGILFSYTEFTFCHFNYKFVPLIILSSILFILFISTSILADEFLCPSLLTVSKVLRLPDNIAGVTLLAFGNGSPDIFASIGGISESENPQLIFSSLYGACIFVTTIITGSILLTGDFKAKERPLIRDLLFFIGAAFLVWIIIFNQTIRLVEIIFLFCYYLIFVFVIIFGRFIYLKQLKKRTVETLTEKNMVWNMENQMKNIDTERQTNVNEIINENINNLNAKRHSMITIKSDDIIDEFDRLSDENFFLSKFYQNGRLGSTRSRKSIHSQHLVHHHWENTVRRLSRVYEANIDAAKIKQPNYVRQLSNITKQNFTDLMSESKLFFLHLCPIDLEEWSNYSLYKKLIELTKAIPYCLLTICIPVVDLESINENWCRLLICLNILVFPQVLIHCLLSLHNIVIHENFPVPIWIFFLMLSIILDIVILLTSDKAKPPIYHRFFAFIGFCTSILFIKFIVNEIIDILTTFGIVFHISNSILGLTVLAWGNSIGDFMSNISMTRHGYHVIAISACFGGPILNLLIGLSIPYLIIFIRNPDVIHVEYSKMITLLYGTLTISLCISLIFFILFRFRSTRLHGFILILIYIIYIILALLLEFHVI